MADRAQASLTQRSPPSSRARASFDRNGGCFIRLAAISLLAAAAVRRATALPSVMPRYFSNGTVTTASCAAKYSCLSQSAEPKECSCHELCHLFDTCCADARPSNWRELRMPTQEYSCQLVYDISSGLLTYFMGVQEIFVLTRCPSGFETSFIDDLCQHPISETGDGKLSTLVSDASTGVTYRNIFCAFCQGVNISNALNWKPSNVCAMNPSTGNISCQIGYLPPDNLTASIPDCRWNTVMSCPENSTLVNSLACSDSPARYIYDIGPHGRRFRNWNCSLCYQQPLAIWRCIEPPIISNAISTVVSNDFNVLLVHDNYCPSELNSFMTIDEQQFWKWLCPDTTYGFGNCTESLDGASMQLLYESAVESEYNFTAAGVWLRINSSVVACTQCKPISYFGAPTYNSTSQVVSVAGTSYARPFFKVFGNQTYVVCSTEVTADDTALESCDALPTEVSVVLMSLSLAGLAGYAIAYCVMPSMHNLPGQIILNESAAFFIAFLAFLLRPLAASSRSACEVMAVLVHYFFMAAFTWTSVYAVEVVRALGFQAYGTRFTSRRARYMVIGWFVPALIVAAGVATDLTTSHNIYRPAYGGPQCFISNAIGQRIFFIGPLAVFLSVSIFIYSYMIVKLVVICGQTKMVRDSHYEKLSLAIKLVFALGVMWVFAIGGSATGNCIVSYLFTLLNTLQGVLILIVFVCNSHIAGKLLHRLKRQHSTSSANNLASTQKTRTSIASISSSSITEISQKPVNGVHRLSTAIFARRGSEDISAS